MSVLKAVVVCLALLLTAETTTDAQVTKYDTSKGSFRSDDDANTNKSSEEREIRFPAIEKNIALFFWDELNQFKWALQKRSAMEVFQDMKLAEEAPNLFGNPKFYVWTAYTRNWTKEDWISLLTKNMEPDALKKAISAGIESKDMDVRNFAHDLQQSLARGSGLTLRRVQESWTR